MKVKCVFNLGRFLPRDILAPFVGHDEDTEFDLLIDKEYIVYGMTLHRGYMWYYICDESSDSYPIMKPSPLFDVVDGRLSRCWIYVFMGGENQSSSKTIITYPEWANDPYGYYNKLAKGEPEAVETFERYKKLMDKEFE